MNKSSISRCPICGDHGVYVEYEIGEDGKPNEIVCTNCDNSLDRFPTIQNELSSRVGRNVMNRSEQ